MSFRFLYLILSCSHFLYTKINAQYNLEEFKQDFVLETKQIIIEKMPHAFNPSIVKWGSNFLMSFRCIKNPFNTTPSTSCGDSSIYLVWFDNNFIPLSEPVEVNISGEDGRLLVNETKLFLIYNGNSNRNESRVYIAELDIDNANFRVIRNECLSDFNGEIPYRLEKNWVPFIHNNELLLTYSLFPHKILKPLLNGSQRCEQKAFSYPSIVWEWGELRGGTPALKIDEEHFLSFFHFSIPLSTSHSNNEPLIHYFMGGYLFSSHPPFHIKKISPEPIIGQNFYQGPIYTPYWHPLRVVFPCGLILDEKYVWISYGRQDHEMWIAKLDKSRLLESLINVSTLPESY